jgi:Skp family chaperone for outer membrane proteins
MFRIRFLYFLIIIALMPVSGVFAQKVAYVSSDLIREKIPEAKQAQQRIQSMVEDWKRELIHMQKGINELCSEIDNSKYIWSEKHKANNDSALGNLIKNRKEFAKSKFEPGGEYDRMTKKIMKPVEEKIQLLLVKELEYYKEK